MSWEAGQRYRGRVVVGQTQVERIGQKKTPLATSIIEVSSVGNEGRRVRWRGWLNTPDNARETIAELRVMGMRSAQLGEWQGLGSKEFEFTLMKDEGDDGKTYYRAAFVRALATVNTERAVEDDDLAVLNARLAGVLGAPAEPPGGPVPVPDATGTEEIPF